MNESTKTKKALRGSLLALFLCIVLLIGTTFAWFTDTASTGVNKIQSGNLKVDLEYATAWNADGSVKTWESAVGKTLDFQKAKGAENETILWEPGCKYKLPEIRVVNKGNLALKYRIKIDGIKGDAKLNEVIDWTIGDNTIDAEKVLNAGKASDPMTIQGHMQESAGNEYQNLSIDGITITVYATQASVESDSFGPEYDKMAAYNISAKDANGLTKAINDAEAGDTITFDEDVVITPVVEDITESTLVPQTVLNKSATLNLAGKKLTVDGATADYGKASPLIMNVDGADTNVTIEGDGEINCEAGNNQVYGINITNGASLTIKDGKYYGAITAIQVEKGSLKIEGGFFDMAPTCKAAVPHYAKYVVNAIDSAYKNGTATISITGGTFVNFDPSANPEGEGTSYVADGYKVVSEAHGSDTWYTVVPK